VAEREELLAEIASLQAQLAEAHSITAGAPMVSAYRGYVNKRKGNEHSRVVDVAANDPDEAQTKILALIKKSEVLEQIVSITVSAEHELV
jgi:hypothetical protein